MCSFSPETGDTKMLLGPKADPPRFRHCCSKTWLISDGWHSKIGGVLLEAATHTHTSKGTTRCICIYGAHFRTFLLHHQHSSTSAPHSLLQKQPGFCCKHLVIHPLSVSVVSRLLTSILYHPLCKYNTKLPHSSCNFPFSFLCFLAALHCRMQWIHRLLDHSGNIANNSIAYFHA